MAGAPAAQFKFNSFQEIRSHSSVLYNERLAILFYLLDMDHLALYRQKDVTGLYKVYSLLKQIYNNTRMLLRFNEAARVELNLDTAVEGIYTTDVAFAIVERMLRYCEREGFTEKKINIIMFELDNIEIMSKDILQYFMYFIRPDFRQKPDIDTATEKYKSIADKNTIDELKELVGKRNRIDFNELGSDKIEFTEEVEYDPDVDGPIDEYSTNPNSKKEKEGLYLDFADSEQGEGEGFLSSSEDARDEDYRQEKEAKELNLSPAETKYYKGDYDDKLEDEDEDEANGENKDGADEEESESPVDYDDAYDDEQIADDLSNNESNWD